MTNLPTKIITEQKADVLQKLSVKLITRTKLVEAQSALDTQLIKVITGPRRSGKSVFALMLLGDKEFAYINFDNDDIIKLTHTELHQALVSVYPNARYVFLDEIQNLPAWELFLNDLQRKGYNLVVTGSNAKLISGELATHLTGRYQEISILPLSFKELATYRFPQYFDEAGALLDTLTFAQKAELKALFNSFLILGGFPEPNINQNGHIAYAEMLVKSALLNDVVKRYKVRQVVVLESLFNNMVANFTHEFTYTKLKDMFGYKSVYTVQNYIKYMETTFLLLTLNRFSPSYRDVYKYPKKVYLIDNSIFKSGFSVSPNYGLLLENAVFTQYVRCGYRPNFDLFYYKTKNLKEIDFLVKRANEPVILTQVTWELSGDKVIDRELGAFMEATREIKDSTPVLLVGDTNQDEETISYKGLDVKVLSAWRWFLQE